MTKVVFKDKKNKKDKSVNNLEDWSKVIQDHHNPSKLIHIEDLFTAFQQFMNDQRNGISSIRQPNKWQAAMEKAVEDFKKKIGPLAEYIDWSKRE